jgi:hypothetical protein
VHQRGRGGWVVVGEGDAWARGCGRVGVGLHLCRGACMWARGCGCGRRSGWGAGCTDGVEAAHKARTGRAGAGWHPFPSPLKYHVPLLLGAPLPPPPPLPCHGSRASSPPAAARPPAATATARPARAVMRARHPRVSGPAQVQAQAPAPRIHGFRAETLDPKSCKCGLRPPPASAPACHLALCRRVPPAPPLPPSSLAWPLDPRAGSTGGCSRQAV